MRRVMFDKFIALQSRDQQDGINARTNVRLKGDKLVRGVSSVVDIVSGQVMPSAAQTIRRGDASICRHKEGVMETDSSPYAATV